MTDIPIILASHSPRRKQLLEQIDLAFTVEPSGIHEEKHNGQSPEQYASELASAKSAAVSKQFPDALVIGADTIVVHKDQILGKPADRDDAYRILSCLSGQKHKVITAVSIRSLHHDISELFHEATIVSFVELGDSDIYEYIDTYKPYDKAGSYGIQDRFSVWIDHIEGCFFNVMGFPLSAFYERYTSIMNCIENNRPNTVGGKDLSR